MSCYVKGIDFCFLCFVEDDMVEGGMSAAFWARQWYYCLGGKCSEMTTELYP